MHGDETGNHANTETSDNSAYDCEENETITVRGEETEGETTKRNDDSLNAANFVSS